MVAFENIAWSCLVLAPLNVNAGACKPKSTELTTYSTEFTTSSAEILTTWTETAATSTSEAPTTTTSMPSAPCPRWTQINPPPPNKVCGKEVTRGTSDSSPLYISSNVRTDGITGCAKNCGDTEGCVSFYAEDFVPGPGAPTFKVCFLFGGYEKDIPFGEGVPDRPTYYEQGCFACVRD
ncbi:hypothetical protein F66182_4857 [Fusarium sp. NRRL 66182]|nr:hypothetical protein F66182_4857 [Fusarium sp. NRRL 66182]